MAKEKNCERCGEKIIVETLRTRYCKKCSDWLKKERSRIGHNKLYAERKESGEAIVKCLTAAQVIEIQCPFYNKAEHLSRFAMRCEGNLCIVFDTEKEQLLHMESYCMKNPEWEKCPTAKKLLKKYF